MLVFLISLALATHVMDRPTMDWEEWKIMFNKGYAATEHNHRQKVFEANMKKIEAHNGKGLSWTMGVNQFADLEAWEFKQQISSPFKKQESRKVRWFNSTKYGNPSDLDWVSKGAVSPVKNQGQCGSCWAFSTIGAVEGCYAIANGEASNPSGVTQFSEQNLVDCSTQNSACQGGLMDYAFQFIINQQHGNMMETAYPYKAVKGTCESHPVTETINDYDDVQQNSAQQMENALNVGPVSIAIEADQNAFQFYNGGVFTGNCGTNLDHGVLAVGYGTEGGEQYWKVKNSWGASWGEQGYIRLERGKNQSGGQCGLLKAASVPKCSSSPGPGPHTTDHTTPAPGPSDGPYGPPTNGACPNGEVLVNNQVDGDMSGEFCGVTCDSGMNCPDAPSGYVGTFSSCGIYSYSTGHLYCGLFCNPQSQDSCNPSAGSTCKTYGGYTGLCSYD